MTHSLNERMAYIRTANSLTKALTDRERTVLVYLITRVPMDPEEGWLLRTDVIAAECFPRLTTNSGKVAARQALNSLEIKEAIERVWAGSKHDHNQSATYFVNWERMDLVASEIRATNSHPEPVADIVPLRAAR